MYTHFFPPTFVSAEEIDVGGVVRQREDQRPHPEDHAETQQKAVTEKDVIMTFTPVFMLVGDNQLIWQKRID